MLMNKPYGVFDLFVHETHCTNVTFSICNTFKTYYCTLKKVNDQKLSTRLSVS